MELGDALRIIAKQLLVYGLDQVDWEDFPDIGENDWEAVKAEAHVLIDHPNRAAVDEAYALLTARAGGLPTEVKGDC